MKNNHLPSLFVSHGAPLLALEPGETGAALHRFAQGLPRPEAILVVSAHWATATPTLSIACRPQTIHDFYGFPEALYAMHYPAPGAVRWAMEARGLLEDAGFEVTLDANRGLDHGAWVPLLLMYPEADIPVFTLSIQPERDPAHHLALGRALAGLRQAGVLVIGSGNLTHNLGHFRGGRGMTYPYVKAFQEWVGQVLESHDFQALLDYRQQAPGAVEAHPTDEHWLPFYVALGAAGEAFEAEPVYRGVQYGMLAMDSYAFWTQEVHNAAHQAFQ